MPEKENISSSSPTSSGSYSTQRSTTFKLFLIACVLTCITNFFSAFAHTSINTAVDQVNDYIRTSYAKRGLDWNDNQVNLFRGIYNGIWYAGQVIGSLLSPKFMDKYGRKASYLLSTAMMTLATSIQLIATLTKYPEILIAGRVVGSFFSPIKVRGALSSLCATGYFIMTLFGMMLGMKSILGHNLTILLGVPIPPGLMALAFLLYLPETPKFLMIVKQDRLAAKKSLVFYQGDQPTNDEILDEFINETKNEPDAKRSLSDLLFVPYLRKALLLANAVLMLTVPFFAILLSSTYFLMEIDIPSHVAQLSSTFLAVVLILTCFIATYLLKIFGRRPLLNFSGIGSIISLCVFTIAGKFYEQNDIMKYIALGGMVGYMVCYGLAIGPISWFISAELVSLHYRASMFCAVLCVNSFCVVATNLAAVPLFNVIGSFIFLPLFVVPSTISLIYLFFALPETKDCETYQIVQMLKDGKLYSEKSECTKC